MISFKKNNSREIVNNMMLQVGASEQVLDKLINHTE